MLVRYPIREKEGELVTQRKRDRTPTIAERVVHHRIREEQKINRIQSLTNSDFVRARVLTADDMIYNHPKKLVNLRSCEKLDLLSGVWIY